MVFECFSDCLLECSGMLGRLIGWLFECFSYCSVECLVGDAWKVGWWCLNATLIVWQSVCGSLEGWLVVLDSFSYCLCSVW